MQTPFVAELPNLACLTHVGRADILGSATPLIPRVPGIRNFGVLLPVFISTPFNAERPNSAGNTYVTGMFLGG